MWSWREILIQTLWMHLLAKFDDRSYRNGGIISYINSYMETAELTASIRRIVRCLKSRICIYNSEILDTAGRKTRRRRKTQAIAKCFAFYANAKICLTIVQTFAELFSVNLFKQILLNVKTFCVDYRVNEKKSVIQNVLLYRVLSFRFLVLNGIDSQYYCRLTRLF